MKKFIAAAVKKKYEKKLQEDQSGVEDDAKICSYIVSSMSSDASHNKATPAKALASTATARKAPTLNSILKRAKNGSS
jgi:hypothetical protein